MRKSEMWVKERETVSVIVCLTLKVATLSQSLVFYEDSFAQSSYYLPPPVFVYVAPTQPLNAVNNLFNEPFR